MYAGAVGDRFILMYGDVRPQTTNAVLQREGISRLDWPTQLPNLKPIKNM